MVAGEDGEDGGRNGDREWWVRVRAEGGMVRGKEWLGGEITAFLKGS